MSLFRTQKVLNVHFPTFLLSAFLPHKGGSTYRLKEQRIYLSLPRPPPTDETFLLKNETFVRENERFVILFCSMW